MAFNPPATVLPLYVRGPVAPSPLRRGLVLGAQLAAAVGYGFAAVLLPPQQLYILILPVAACLLAALWLLPDRGFFPLGAIQRVYPVLLVLMVVWPSYIAIVLPGLPWLTPTRITLFILTFFFLYSVSTSAQLRHHLAAVARSAKLLWLAFVLWQVSMIVTIPFSHDVTHTIKMLIDNQLRLTEMFFLGCLIFAWRGVPTRTAAWFVVLAVIASLDGLVELRMEMPPWALHIPSFMRVDDSILANVLGSQARSADGLYRVRGPFTNSLIYAEYLAICTPFMLHWIITGRSFLLRVTMIGAWLLTMTGILISQSRLGLVGALLAVGTYLPLWAVRQWRADRSSLVGPSILFGAPFMALALLGVVFSSHTLSTRVLGGGAQAASNQARVDQRRMAIPKVAANPIGHGLGQSGGVLGFTNAAGVITVDNHYITTVLDLGIAGLVGFYGMFVYGAWLGIKLYLSSSDRETELAGPLAATFSIFLVVKSVLSQEDNHPLLLLLLGMLLALWARERGLFDPDRLFPWATRSAKPALGARSSAG